MSRLDARLGKLEKQLAPNEDIPGIIFVSFVSPHGEASSPSLAIIIGGGGGRLKRRENETEEDFELRAYATKAAGCSLDELDDEKVVAAYEMGLVLKAEDRAK